MISKGRSRSYSLRRTARTGVTFPPELLSELDRIVERIGYTSRSKAIQDSVKSYITEQKWLSDQKGEKIGVLVLVYDHESRGVEDYLTDTEHEYASLVCSSTHVHLTKRDCLETMVVRGRASKIRELTEKFQTRKGVKQARLTIVSP